MPPLSAGQPAPGEVVWSARPRSVLLAPSPAPRHSNYTPKHLAERIIHLKAALEDQRNQVTVLAS